MALKFTTSYLEDSLELFGYYTRLADRAMEQTPGMRCLALSTGNRTQSRLL